MPQATLQLLHYLQRVQRESGQTVSTSFPSSPTDDQQHALDSINATLRELNADYYLAFEQVEYLLTTTAGTSSYDLTQSPYNQTYWRVNRMARGAVRRKKDDYPLMFIDYTERDYLQPSLTANALPTHYSQFAGNLLFYPAPDGSQVYVRYYPAYIGTDSTHTTQKTTLTATDDIPLLLDEWEDALVYGAAAKVRRKQKTDEKYQELNKIWEDWKARLQSMMGAGEENAPQLMLATHTENYLDRKIGPLFNANF